MSTMSRLRRQLARLSARLRLRPARPSARARPSLAKGRELVEAPLAGLTFHEEGEAALDLKILESVTLQPEPQNPHDPNAVVVTTRKGRPVGHLPRDIACFVAPALEAGRMDSVGVVTELRSNAAATSIGVRITFGIDRDVPLMSSGAIEFCCERGEAGTTYLLVNCDVATLDKIKDGLAAQGLVCERSGQAFRQPSDGHVYEWYLRMGEDVAPEAVIAYLAEAYRAAPWTPAWRAIDEYAEGFDKELADKDARIATLEQLLAAERELARQAEKGRRRAEASALQRFMASVLPNVTVLRSSWDVLASEIHEPENVLRDLVRISFVEDGVPATSVRGAAGWKELHFNTGQGENGRLYFRRTNGHIETLISFKGDQERDIQYLSRR